MKSKFKIGDYVRTTYIYEKYKNEDLFGKIKAIKINHDCKNEYLIKFNKKISMFNDLYLTSFDNFKIIDNIKYYDIFFETWLIKYNPPVLKKFIEEMEKEK